jgi:hypothetical protein
MTPHIQIGSLWDLEGSLRSGKDGPCIGENKRSTWIKIKNPGYSQLEGREELFARSL